MAYIGKTPSQAVRQRYYYTASGSETSLSGADDNSNTLAFSDGEYVDVSLNGVSLVAGTDYNTNTANTIAGLSALAASDVVEIVVYDTFSVHSGTFNGGVTVDNLKIDGNTISSTDTNGDVNITPNGSGKVKVDNISIDGNTIAAEDTGGDIVLAPNGSGDVEINLADTGSVVKINKDDSGSGSGPTIQFERTSSSPADGDDIGKILFRGTGSTGSQITFAQISVEMDDVSASTPNGSLKFDVSGDSVASGTAALELMTELGTTADGIVKFGNEPTLVWVEHKNTSFDCTLDWEIPTQANTVSFPNATGTLGYVALSTTTITSDTATIDIDNLPDEFDSFVFHINAHPVSDGVTFNARFIDSSGSAILDANTYAYYRPTDGSDSSSDGSTVMQLTAGTIGTSTNEGIVCDLLLQGRNFSPDAEVVPPTLQGHVVGHYSNSAVSGGTFYGMMTDNNAQAIRGVQFLMGGNTDVAKATIHVYGIQNT